MQLKHLDFYLTKDNDEVEPGRRLSQIVGLENPVGRKNFQYLIQTRQDTEKRSPATSNRIHALLPDGEINPVFTSYDDARS